MLTRVLVIVAAIALLGGGGYWITQTRQPGDSISRLLEDLENVDPDISGRAQAEVLSRGAELVPALLDALEGTQATAAAAGGGSKAHVETTLGRERMRRQAIRAFAVLGEKGQSASPRLLEMMESPEQAHYAARALVGIGRVEALGPFQAHKDTTVRLAVAAALGRASTQKAEALEGLVISTKDLDASVRSAAMESFGLLQADAPRSVAVLIAVLNDTEGDVRAAAAKSLGQYGPQARGAVSALETLARDRDQQTRRAARRALELINPAR